MSFLLKLDSSILDNQQTSEDFTVTFNPPIILEGNYEICLFQLNLWYSWYNISTIKSNNTFRYNNGVTWETVNIPDGQYTLEQLNDLLHDVMKENGDFTIDAFGLEQYDIIIEPNFSTLRTNITLTNSYQLDLSTSNLYLLLGWESQIYNFTGSQDGVNVANINDDINSLLVHCDKINGNYTLSNNDASDVMFSFVPESIPGTNINITPNNLLYLPITTRANVISSMRMYITDNLNRVVRLNGEPVTYMLHLRKINNPVENNI